MLLCEDLPNPLSSLYSHLSTMSNPRILKLWERWHANFPSLSKDEWENCLLQFAPPLISLRDQFLQLKFVHRVHYTPQWLATIYPNRSDTCLCCDLKTDSYLHVFWICSKTHTYWQSVVNTINALGILVLPMDPLILLLGLTDTLNASKHIKLFLFYAMTMLDGRFSKWKSPAPPTVLSWKVAINGSHL